MRLPPGLAPDPRPLGPPGATLTCARADTGPWNVTDADDASLRLLGAERPAIIGRPLLDRFVVCEPDLSALCDVARDDAPVSFEAAVVAADGHLAHVTGTARFDPEGSALVLSFDETPDAAAMRLAGLVRRMGRHVAPDAAARAALSALADALGATAVDVYAVHGDTLERVGLTEALAAPHAARLSAFGRIATGRPAVVAGADTGWPGPGTHLVTTVPDDDSPEALILVRGAAGWAPRPADVVLLADAAPVVWSAVDRARTVGAVDAQRAADRRLFESMGHGVVACELVRDADGTVLDVRYLDVNPAFDVQTGLRGEVAAGRRRSEVVPEMDESWLAQYVRAVATAQTVRFEAYAAPLERWLDVSVLPQDGDRFWLIFDDITARRDAETEQAERSARHAFLVRLNDRLRLCTEPPDVLATANRLLATQLGADRSCYGEVTDDGLVVRSDYHTARLPSAAGWYPADRLPAASEAPRPVVVGGQPGEAPAPAPWDALGAPAFVGVPLVRDGRLSGVLCVASADPRAWTDAEVRLVEDAAEATRAAVERANADRAMRESEALYRLLANMAPALVWMTDPDGRSTFFNEAWTVFSGRDADELLRPGTVAQVIHPEDYTPVLEGWRRGAADGLGFSCEYRLRNAAGDYEWHAARAEPILGPDGAIAGWVGAALNVDAHRRVQQALRESDELYRILVENATEYALLAAADDARILLWSQGAERIFGYAEDEILGQDMAVLFTAEDRAAGVPEREKGRAVDHGRASDDRWHVRKDGSRFFATGVLTRVDHPDGSHRGFVKVLRDNTVRKVAQDALRASEARFRALAAAVPQIVWTMEQEGDSTVVTYLNERWFEFTGQTHEHAYADGTWDAIHPDDVPATTAGWEHAVRAGEAFAGEMRLRAHDGRYEWHLARSIPVVDDATGRVTWYGTSTNVHAARTAEQALAESAAALAEANRTLEDRVADRTAALAETAEQLQSSEARFRLLFETVPVGIGLARPDGIVVAVNPEMSAILGYAADDLVGRTWRDLTHPDDHALEHVLVREVDAGLRDAYTIEKRYLRPDGSLVWVRLSVTAVRGADGAVDHLVGTVQDVSDRRGTELAALEAAEAERRRLSHELHDDLGQRIASAAMMSATIARRLGGEEHILADATQRLGGILQDALTLTRGLSRGLAPVDLAHDGLVSALWRLCDTTTEAYGIPCRLDAPERVPVGDPGVATHLFRIAQEAVSNAARHARASLIRVGLGVEDGKLVLEVEDDGVGVPASAVSAETGLGLRSVRARAAALHGSLLIVAREPRGTRVLVTVPMPAPSTG